MKDEKIKRKKSRVVQDEKVGVAENIMKHYIAALNILYQKRKNFNVQKTPTHVSFSLLENHLPENSCH